MAGLLEAMRTCIAWDTDFLSLIDLLLAKFSENCPTNTEQPV